MLKILPVALLSVLSCLPLPVMAQGADDVIKLEVLPGWDTDHGTHMAGLRLSMAPGWKTYWRAPGDAGIPPAFDWSGSENIARAELHWPVPEVFHLNGMQSIGYTGQVVIPIELTPTAPGGETRLAGQVELGVCDEICVPVHLSFDAALPVTGQRNVAIATALVDRPMTAAEAKVGDVSCSVEPSDDGLWVTAQMNMPPAGGDEVVVIEAGDPRIWVSESESWRSGNMLTAKVEMIHVSGKAFALDRSAMRITVLGRDEAVDISGCSG
ncbi:MAG: protein-disulfide reductase DsbD family protein [Rhodobacterales bacterium]|jgi:hypothetical protein|nr:protein-disulfide reductase DsbD family protein [Rhodobacterales bacterium]